MNPSCTPSYTYTPLIYTPHRFFHVGIGAQDGVHHEKSTLYTGTHFQEKTLATIMAEMGAPHIDIIRLDTEGAEWEVLTQWLMSGVMKKVNQLLIEVHDWGADRYGQTTY